MQGTLFDKFYRTSQNNVNDAWFQRTIRRYENPVTQCVTMLYWFLSIRQCPIGSSFSYIFSVIYLELYGKSNI